MVRRKRERLKKEGGKREEREREREREGKRDKLINIKVQYGKRRQVLPRETASFNLLHHKI